MKLVAKWMLFAGQPEAFHFLYGTCGLCGPVSYTLVARVCAFFRPLRNILIVVVHYEFTSVSLSFKWCTYAAKYSLSDCWMSLKQLIDVWMSVFQFLRGGSP